MIEQNLPTLRIHRLTKAQYDSLVAAGKVDPTALYLTPEDSLDLSDVINEQSSSTEIPSAKAVYEAIQAALYVDEDTLV